MSTEKINDSSSLQGVARLLLTAVDVVRQRGSGVIVKWDGERENGKTYTVVWEGDETTGPRFRSDTDDLEWALSQVVSSYECSSLELVPQVASFISAIDRAAGARIFVSLRMIRSEGAVNSHIIIFDPKNKNVQFEQKSEDLSALIQRAAVFLDERFRTDERFTRYPKV